MLGTRHRLPTAAMREQVRIVVPVVAIASHLSPQQHCAAVAPWAFKQGLGTGVCVT